MPAVAAHWPVAPATELGFASGTADRVGIRHGADSPGRLDRVTGTAGLPARLYQIDGGRDSEPVIVTRRQVKVHTMTVTAAAGLAGSSESFAGCGAVFPATVTGSDQSDDRRRRPGSAGLLMIFTVTRGRSAWGD